MNMQPRIFFDCTRTWRSSLHTGIERVVRNIIRASEEVGPSLGVVCRPVVYRPLHGFVAVDSQKLLADQRQPAKSAPSMIKLHLNRWGLAPLARAGRDQTRRAADGIQSIFQPFSRKRLTFLAEDVLILLDSSWTTPYWNEVRRAQEHGTLVGAMIYDLLPIQFPESFTRPQRRCFHTWWDKAYHRADFVASISQNVCAKVLEYHECLQTRRGKLPAGAFRLGADFLTGRSDQPIRPELEALRARPFYLCVGTFSPRKQQAFLLDAFDRLWKQGTKASLVYVGGSGWNSQAFIHRLRSHWEWGKSLHWPDDLSDGELDWCYRNAAGLITASRGEGFNLPIVEALHRNCPVFASDIPIHREVAGNFASYFPKDDVSRLAEQIGQHRPSQTVDTQTPPDHFHWPNWTASCAELIQLIQNLAQQCRTEDLGDQRKAA